MINSEMILQQNSKSLATIIVSYRVLGGYKELAKQCMIELMQRRANGEEFNFEEFIAENVQKYNFTINTKKFLEVKKQLHKSIVSTALESLKNVNNDESPDCEECSNDGVCENEENGNNK